MASVLLFGGSFDPVHFGHLIVSRFVAETLGIKRVVLIPAPKPPHKQGHRLAPSVDRLAMCRLAVSGDHQFEVSNWEIEQSGLSYTLNTVNHFRAVLPSETHLYWLIGKDSLVELGSWYHVGELVDSCTLVTAARPGYENPDLSGLSGPLTSSQIEKLRRHIIISPLIDISATDVRTRVNSGHGIRYLVPDSVAAYISERGLYRDG